MHREAQLVEQPSLEQFGDDGDAVDGDVAALASPQVTDEVEEVALDDVLFCHSSGPVRVRVLWAGGARRAWGSRARARW